MKNGSHFTNTATIRIQLRNEVRKGSFSTYERQVALQEKRRRLQSKIDSFISQSDSYVGYLHRTPESIIDAHWFNQDDTDDTDIQHDLYHSHDPSSEALAPETISLTLPSSLSREERATRLRNLSHTELQLRKGQANDALHHLRVAIAHKSFLYRARVRKNAPTNSFVKRMRSYGDVLAVQMTIDQAAKIYETARSALKLLGASAGTLATYKELEDGDLVASTAVVDPNARGQRQAKLSWIWQTLADKDSPDVMNESMCIYSLFPYLH